MTGLNTVTENGVLRVTGVQTGNGEFQLGPDGKVIMALSTIESTRLALLSFKPKLPPALIGPIGQNWPWLVRRHN